MPLNCTNVQIPKEFETNRNEEKLLFPNNHPMLPEGYHHENEKREKREKMHKMIDIASTGLRRSTKLDNKPKLKYGLFDQFSLSVIGACEVSKNLHIFLTRALKHTQEINIKFDGTLNYFGPMVFAANKKQS